MGRETLALEQQRFIQRSFNAITIITSKPKYYYTVVSEEHSNKGRNVQRKCFPPTDI